MLRFGIQLDFDNPIHLEFIVEACGIELHAQVENQVRVSDTRKLGCLVVGLECGEDLLGIVHEVHDVCGVLPRMGAVKARQGLHGRDAREALVHIHAAKKRLVKARLELVGH